MGDGERERQEKGEKMAHANKREVEKCAKRLTVSIGGRTKSTANKNGSRNNPDHPFPKTQTRKGETLRKSVEGARMVVY